MKSVSRRDAIAIIGSAFVPVVLSSRNSTSFEEIDRTEFAGRSNVSRSATEYFDKNKTEATLAGEMSEGEIIIYNENLEEHIRDDNIRRGITEGLQMLESGEELILTAGTYEIDLLKNPNGRGIFIDKSGVTLSGVGPDTQIILSSQDYSKIHRSGLIEVVGNKKNVLSNVTIKDMLLDFRRGAHVGTPQKEHAYEIIEIDWARDFEIRSVTCINSVSEGIDLDFCKDFTIKNCHCERNYGYGIHVSLESTDGEVLNNTVIANGFKNNRGGIDQWKTASGTTYRNNTSIGNWRNYDIRGSSATFENNVSRGGIKQNDLSGVQ